MKLILLFLFSLNLFAANYAHICNGEIVSKYSSSSPKFFGGAWGSIGCESKEIPSEVNSDLASLDEDGEIIQRELTSEEVEMKAKQEIDDNIEKGRRVVTHVIRLNDKRAASEETKLSFIGHAQIELAQRLLNVGRISMARSVIASISPDGTIVTSELKQAVLDYIDSL